MVRRNLAIGESLVIRSLPVWSSALGFKRSQVQLACSWNFATVTYCTLGYHWVSEFREVADQMITLVRGFLRWNFSHEFTQEPGAHTGQQLIGEPSCSYVMTNKIWAVRVESSCPGMNVRPLLFSENEEADHQEQQTGAKGHPHFWGSILLLPTGSSPMAAGMVATRPHVCVSNFRAKNFEVEGLQWSFFQ